MTTLNTLQDPADAERKLHREIRFGAMAPKLRDQDVCAIIPRKRVAEFQKAADAITRLYVNDYLPPIQADLAYKRLVKAITREIRAARQTGAS